MPGEVENVFIAIAVIAAVVFILVLGSLPGSVARGRRHSKHEAIKVCGWLGLLFFPAWIAAMVWAFTEDNRDSIAGPRGFPVGELNNKEV